MRGCDYRKACVPEDGLRIRGLFPVSLIFAGHTHGCVMSRFVGTTGEFKRYIGPYLRNVVQQITRKQKAKLGACEHCGANGELDAAHVHGRDRTDIINLLLGTSDPDAMVDVDLIEIDRAFRREHDPVEKAILVLCSTCHRTYDTLPVQASARNPARSAATGQTQHAYSSYEVLPISLYPARPDDFTAKLLERREALVEILYADGSVVRKPWDASRFSESSNLLRNLRSRQEFRQGVWQKSGIVKVNVQVAE